MRNIYLPFILGIWLILSGILLFLQGSANLMIVGILTAITGLLGSKNWKNWVIGILGLWLFFSGSVFNMVYSWNFIISGIILGLLGLWYTVAPDHKKKPPRSKKNWSVLED